MVVVLQSFVWPQIDLRVVYFTEHGESRWRNCQAFLLALLFTLLSPPLIFYLQLNQFIYYVLHQEYMQEVSVLLKNI